MSMARDLRRLANEGRAFASSSGDELRAIAWEIERLTKRITELEADNERLQAIVDKLPKTADGVPVVPEMPLYMPGSNTVGEVNPMTVNDGYSWPNANGSSPASRLDDCYSTREAAEAAKDSE